MLPNPAALSYLIVLILKLQLIDHCGFLLRLNVIVLHRDPFLLSADPVLKRTAANSRKKFAAESKSDHMVLLRAFQGELAIFF